MSERHFALPRCALVRQPSGFTLVEVLVALTILAVTLAAGVKAAAALAGNSERLELMMAAQWCAENQLTALKLSRQYPEIGDSPFACEQLGRRYAGSLQVRGTPNPNFRRIEARVSEADGQTLLGVTTLIGRW